MLALPAPPSSFLRPPFYTQNRPPMRGPMRALCAPPMRGPRSSIDLDRAPCFEINPKNGTYAQAPMRGTRFSMDLDRAPCSGTTTKRGILCVSPYARATIFSGFRSCTLLRSQPQNGTYAQAPMRGPIRAPYARDTPINRNKSWTLLRNHYKKRHPMRGPMRAPCARTRFY